jgi:hypothetical protein
MRIAREKAFSIRDQLDIQILWQVLVLDVKVHPLMVAGWLECYQWSLSSLGQWE